MGSLILLWKQLVSRPAVSAAVLAVVGTSLYRALPMNPPLWMVVSAMGVLIATLLHRWAHLACSALAVTMVLVFCGAAQLRAFYLPADHIVQWSTGDPQLVHLRGVVTAPPRLTSQPVLPGYTSTGREVFQLRAQGIKTIRGWVDASGLVQASVRFIIPDGITDDSRSSGSGVSVGQAVEVLGTLSRPAPARNPGQFDYASYSRYRGELVTLNIATPQNIAVIDAGSTSWLWVLRQQARQALAKGFDSYQTLDRALLAALFLGEREPVIRQVQDLFLTTGTSHHLAISGMHVAVLGGFVYSLCRLLRLDPRRAAQVGLVFVALYGLVTVPSPPVVRSVLLCLCFGVGIITRRSTDALQLLALTVVALLIYSPLDLFQPGFQLSYGCVLGLIVLTQPISSLLSIRRSSLDVGSLTLTPSRARRLVRLIGRWGRGALAAGIAAWLVSVPLVGWHFNRLNPFAVLASIILGVPVFFGLVGGLLKVVFTLICPWGAGLWAWIAQGPIIAMRHLAGWLALVPASDWPIAAMPVILIVLYYLVLVASRWSGHSFYGWTKWMKYNPLVLGVGVLIFSFLPQHWVWPNRPMSVTVLSVGAGSCAVAGLATGQTLIFDAGSNSMSDPYRSIIGPFLQHEGVRSIDTVFLSHGDRDHYNAVARLLEHYTVRRIITTRQFAQDCATDDAGQTLLTMIGRLRIPVQFAAQGDRFSYGTAQIDVLWPPAIAQSMRNNSSLVLKMTYAHRSILFTGDIQIEPERKLMRQPDRIKSDILIAPHHGSAEVSTRDFILAADPSLVISSNGARLTRKQRLFDRLISPSTAFYRTHKTGAMMLAITPEGALESRPFLPDKP